MDIERDLEIVKTAVRAFVAQIIQGFGARIAFALLAFDLETLAAEIFVIGEVRGVRRAAFRTRKRARSVGFETVFLQCAPHIGLRTADFSGDLRST